MERHTFLERVSLLLRQRDETLATEFSHMFHSQILSCTIFTCTHLSENPDGERGRHCIIKHTNYSSVILLYDFIVKSVMAVEKGSGIWSEHAFMISLKIGGISLCSYKCMCSPYK